MKALVILLTAIASICAGAPANQTLSLSIWDTTAPASYRPTLFPVAGQNGKVLGVSGGTWALVTSSDTAAVWGNITGTLSNQTDLAAALAALQPLDADLTSISSLTTTAFGRGLLDDADATAARTSLGVVIGTDVQAFDADLSDLADGTLSGSKVGTGIDAANLTTGTLPDARFPATLPAASGVNLTALNGSNIASGTVDTARLNASTGVGSAVDSGKVVKFDANGSIVVADLTAAGGLVSGTNNDTGGTLQLNDGNSGFSTTLTANNLTANRGWTLPDDSSGNLAIASRGYLAAGYQPLDADLTSIAALTTTAFGRGLLDDADASAGRTSLGVVIGTDVLAPNGNGSSLTALTAANITASTTAGRNVLNVTNPGAISFLKFAADNTVSTRTPSQVVSDLSLTIGTDVQAFDSDLTDLADGSLTGSKVGTGIDAANVTTGELPDARLSANVTKLGAAIDLSGAEATGTLADARFPATLPAASGVNLTALNATNLASGTVPDARFPATLPAASGVNLTALNAANLSSGTIPTARLGSTTAEKLALLRAAHAKGRRVFPMYGWSATSNITGTASAAGSSTTDFFPRVLVSAATNGKGRVACDVSSGGNIFPGTTPSIVDYGQAFRVDLALTYVLSAHSSSTISIHLAVASAATITSHTRGEEGLSLIFNGGASTGTVKIQGHNGTTTTDSATASIAISDGGSKDYSLEWEPGVAARLYIDGTLACTLSTGLPSGTTATSGSNGITMLVENTTNGITYNTRGYLCSITVERP